MNNARILLVDDEEEILNIIQIVLRKEGFTQIRKATRAKTAIEECKKFQPQIILLDVMLPDGDGFEVCRELRKLTDAPILFLTARTTDLDKLTGFSTGADDYITKPFNPLEVVARLKAQLRRSLPTMTNSKEQMFDFGRFQVHEKSGQLFVDGVEIPCPAKEFKLLCFLSKHPNQIFSKKQLYEQIWEEESFGIEHTVMVHIRRIREKIEEDPSHPKYLVTIRGLGYKLVKPTMAQ